MTDVRYPNPGGTKEMPPQETKEKPDKPKK